MQRIATWIVKRRYLIFGIFTLLFVFSLFGMQYTQVNYDLSKYLSEETDTKKALNIMNEEFEQTSDIKIMFYDIDKNDVPYIQNRLSAVSHILLVSFDWDNNYLIKENHTYTIFYLNLDVNEYSKEAQEVVQELTTTFEKFDFALGGSVIKTMQMNQKITKQMPLIMGIALVIILAILLLTSTSWLEPFIFLFIIFLSIVFNMGTNFLFGSISYITNTVQAILQMALAMDYSIILLNQYHLAKQTQQKETKAVIAALKKSIVPIFSSALTTIAGLSALMFMSFTIGFDIGLVLIKGIICSMLCVFFIMPGIILLLRKPLEKTKHRQLSLGENKIFSITMKLKNIIVPLFLLVILGGFVLQSQNQYSFSYSKLEGVQQEMVDLFGENNTIVALIPKATTEEDYQKQLQLKEKLMTLKIDDVYVMKSFQSLPTTNAFSLYTPKDVQTLLNTFTLEEIETIFSFFSFSKDGVLAYQLINQISDFLNLSTQLMNKEEMMNYFHFVSSDDENVSGIYGNDKQITPLEFLKRSKENLSSFSNARALQVFDKFMQSPLLMSLFQSLNRQIQLAFSTFNGKNYSRILLQFDMKVEDKRATYVIESLKEILNEFYGEDNYLAGGSMTTYDISHSFRKDVLKVNLITILAILLILGLSFRSYILPLILVFIIQGSIFVSMAISKISNEKIFFMAYLICICIQMGATIDYGIIMCDAYIYARKKTKKDDAIKIAIKTALPSIFTSGCILVIAGFTIGMISTELTISSIGLLLGRGTLISIIFVIFLLPSMLFLFDNLLLKTTKTLQSKDKKIV